MANGFGESFGSAYARSLQMTREEQEKQIEDDERGLITEDLELENPVQQPQPQAPTPQNTGQGTQQQVAGLFPDDNLSQLIAQRRTRG